MHAYGALSHLPGALVVAGAYSHDHGAEVPHHAIPPKALSDIRRARVEIYCGHNHTAVACIHTALLLLGDNASQVPAAVLVSLSQAAWLARRDHYLEAEEALDAALRLVS